MTQRENAWLRHHQQRFMRPDAARYLRPDAARFLAPRSDPVRVYPALARKSEADRARVDREWMRAVPQERALLDALHRELHVIRRDLTLRGGPQGQDIKSNPKQPHWLRGQDGAGRFRRASDSAAGATGVSAGASATPGDAGADPGATAAADDGGTATDRSPAPVGDGGGDLLSGNVGSLGHRRVIVTKPNEPEGSGDGGEGDGEGGGGGNVAAGFGAGNLLAALESLLGSSPADPPPDIPERKPDRSSEVTGFLRAASSWLMRNGGLAADLYTGLMNTADWLQAYQDMIQANRDPPMTLQELHDGVGKKRPGYDDHHIVEQAAASKLGLSRSEIDDPSNLVSIPRLKHYQITGWYGTKTDQFGGLSPREYLSDKNSEERRRVGLQALIGFGVLKP